MNVLDLLIGLLFANALAHYIIGICGIRFLCLFGYSSKGNMAYGLLQFVVASGLFIWQYPLEEIANHGILLGFVFVILSFFVGGKFLVKQFSKSE